MGNRSFWLNNCNALEASMQSISGVVQNAIECGSLCLSKTNCGSFTTKSNDGLDGLQCTLILSGLTDNLVKSSIVVDATDTDGVWNLYANQYVKGC